MLSGVPNNKWAVLIKIAIMWAFVKWRHFLVTHADLVQKLATVGYRAPSVPKNIITLLRNHFAVFPRVL